MSTHQKVTPITLGLAAISLKAKQFFGVYLDTAGTVSLSTDGGRVDGILTNDPLAGEACAVSPTGSGAVMQASCGSAFATPGLEVASDGSGEFVPAGSGDWVVGISVDAAADGDIMEVLQVPMYKKA